MPKIYQERYRRRRYESGLVQLNLWCRPEHRESIRQFADSLRHGPDGARSDSDLPADNPSGDEPKTAENTPPRDAPAVALPGNEQAVRAAWENAEKARRREPAATRHEAAVAELRQAIAIMRSRQSSGLAEHFEGQYRLYLNELQNRKKLLRRARLRTKAS
ncbi:MAG: hypothetical protein V2I82_13270 [Halieaceae bacterium]|jgi:hypothetical protein|nr:hypothetical protein [Halieaceae bacterium]